MNRIQTKQETCGSHELQASCFFLGGMNFHAHSANTAS